MSVVYMYVYVFLTPQTCGTLICHLSKQVSSGTKFSLKSALQFTKSSHKKHLFTLSSHLNNSNATGDTLNL